jgi:hypothetical protein
MLAVARLGKELKAEVDKDFEIRGEVVKLEKRRGYATGLVSLLSEVDGVERIIQVKLSEPDYRIALAANQDGRLVAVRGDLSRAGRVLTLSNPKGFSLVESLNLES